MSLTVIRYDPFAFTVVGREEYYQAPTLDDAIARAKRLVKENNRVQVLVKDGAKVLASVHYVPAKTIGRSGVIGRVHVKRSK